MAVISYVGAVSFFFFFVLLRTLEFSFCIQNNFSYKLYEWWHGMCIYVYARKKRAQMLRRTERGECFSWWHFTETNVHKPIDSRLASLGMSYCTQCVQHKHIKSRILSCTHAYPHNHTHRKVICAIVCCDHREMNKYLLLYKWGEMKRRKKNTKHTVYKINRAQYWYLYFCVAHFVCCVVDFIFQSFISLSQWVNQQHFGLHFHLVHDSYSFRFFVFFFHSFCVAFNIRWSICLWVVCRCVF